MRVKLDENLGEIGKGVLTTAGHSVSTVTEQGLSGTSDDNLYEACRAEERVLVTLDRDFGEVLRFPPANTPGIVILNCRGRASPAFIHALIEDLVALLKLEPLDGRLWIVEAGRVRIHDCREPD
jgi:predicted nuclease of predicted toxin-antitoxin system